MLNTMESAPIDRPILALCKHEADPYIFGNGEKLTPYGCACESFGHVEDGFHVITWIDDDTECGEYGEILAYYPSYWALSNGGEIAANPVGWVDLPIIEN